MCIKKTKIVMLVLAVIILIGGATAFYAFKIEPFRLTTKQFELNEKQGDTDSLKVIQLSDTHIKADFTVKELAKVVDKINEEKADIIVFTGDLYDNYAAYQEDENLVAALQKMQANLGKYAVWGNHDYGGGAVRQYDTLLAEGGFQLLKNEQTVMTTNNNKKVLIAGLDDTMLGQPASLDTTPLTTVDYAMLLSHEPDTASHYFNDGYNLILSGHSHGGQINLPFLPQINRRALQVSQYADNYSSGMYDVGNNQGTKLYVNRGIGTTHISARLGVTPELSVFNIHL